MNDRQEAHVSLFLIVLVVGVLFAAPALVVGLVVLWWAKRWWQRVAVGIALLVGVGVLYLLGERMLMVVEDAVWAMRDGDMVGVAKDIGCLWVLTLPTAPVFALLLAFARLRNPEQAELGVERRKEAAKERRRERARGQRWQHPPWPGVGEPIWRGGQHAAPPHV